MWDGKFLVGKKLGSGSFGDIYLGTHRQTSAEVAIKFELLKSKHLQHEAELYKILAGGLGVPKLGWSGVEGDYNVMVLERLGQSLEDLFVAQKRTFSLRTVLMCAA